MDNLPKTGTSFDETIALQKIKNLYAESRGLNSWAQYLNEYDPNERVFDLIAVEYSNQQVKEAIQKTLDFIRRTTTASIVWEDNYDYSKGVKGAEVDYIPETADEIIKLLNL